MAGDEMKHKPPLRTAKEVADEIGVGICVVRGMLSAKDAPSPVFANRKTGHAARVQWYDHRALRSWLLVRLATK